MGLSVASKAGSTLSTGSSEGNMESLVDYHKVRFKQVPVEIFGIILNEVYHQSHHNDNLKEVASRKSEGTGASGESVEPEALNKKALDIVQRVCICIILPKVSVLVLHCSKGFYLYNTVERVCICIFTIFVHLLI